MQKTDTPNSKKKRFSPIAITGTIGIALFAIYSVAGFFVIPYYCSQILPQKILAATGLHLRSAAIRFNPYTLRFIANTTSLEGENANPIVSIGQISGRVAILSLLRAQWVCNELILRNPRIHIVRQKENSYNINAFLPGRQDSEAYDIMNFSRLPFLFSLNNIEIQQAEILFTDQLTKITHRITNIFLGIPELSNFSYRSKHHISPYCCAIINGKPVKMTGKKDGDTQILSAAFSNLSLKKYQSYLPIPLPFTVESGELDGTIDINFHSANNISDNRGEKLSLAFNLAINKLNLKKAPYAETVFCKKILVEGHYQIIDNAIIINSAHFISPQISYAISASKDHLLPLFDLQATELETNQSITEIPSGKDHNFSLLLKKILVTQGKATLAVTEKKKKRTLWRNITLQGENITAGKRYKEAINENNPGIIDLRAEIPAENPDLKNGKTILHIHSDLFPRQNQPLPHFANMTVDFTNLHIPNTIFDNFAPDITRNKKNFSLTADKAVLGPINGERDSLSLGNLQVTEGSLKTPSQTFSWKELIAKEVSIRDPLHKESITTIQQADIQQLQTSLVLSRKEPPLASAARLPDLFQGHRGIIDQLNLLAGKINIEDRRISPVWYGTINIFFATIQPLQTDSKNESEIRFKGSLAEGQLQLTGTMQFSAPLHDSRLLFTGSRIPVSLFRQQLAMESEEENTPQQMDFSLNTLWINGEMRSRGEVTFSSKEISKDKPQQKITLETELTITPDQQPPPLFHTFFQKFRSWQKEKPADN